MSNPNEIKSYTSKLSILFVEDNDDLRVNTTSILQTLFKTVESVQNGKEALAKYLEYKQNNQATYDIVLSDIEMPKMDGIELTTKIYEENPSQTIIILSAHDETHYLLKLINLGIEQFIQKPIDYQELLNTFFNVSKKILSKDSDEAIGKIVQLSETLIYDKNAKSIQDNGKNIYLTKFEIFFIELLASKVGKIFSNEEIVTHYKELGELIDSPNIRKLVSKLRKKLSKNSIESIYGIGYKLTPYLTD